MKNIDKVLDKVEDNEKKENSIKNAVTNIDHGNKGVLCKVIPGALMFKKVVIMLIALKIDDAPDKWIANIAKSIDIPISDVDSGAYNTQPTPEPSWPFPPGVIKDNVASDAPAT